MRLHRLVLTNYRGVAHREIDFPDHGVVVVSGANEIGKSSMIEALDLLLESKDRSAKKDVKQVKPTYADVGAEVTAEISTGPYRFVYHKRFHKAPRTQLTILEPRREQLTGDEAHDRVRAMLEQTMDTGLWQAQRVLQASSTAAVDLSGCDALSRALDVAAGDTATLSGTEPVLIERIDAEYARYFTGTGRPTGEWSSAIAALADADAEVTRCAELLAEVDDRVHRHAELSEQLAGLTDEQAAADARHSAAQAAGAAIAELRGQLRDAQLVATAAKATGAATDSAHAERHRQRGELESRAAVISLLDTEIDAAAQVQGAVDTEATAADVAAAAAAQAVVAATERAASARRVVDQLAARDEADRLADRLARLDATEGQLAEVTAELTQIVVTEPILRRIEEASAACDRSEASLAAISATLELTAVADIDLVIAGEPAALPGGQSWSATVADGLEVDVPGLLRVLVRPGDSAREASVKHVAAQAELAAALAAAGVPDLTQARHADQRRRELQGSRDQLAAALAALRGDEEIEALRARLTRLRGEHGEIPAGITPEQARADRDQAEALRAQAATDGEALRRAAAETAARRTEAATRLTLLREKVAAQRGELEAVSQRLAAQRTTVSDDELAAAAESNSQALRTAEQRVAQLTEQLGAAAPEAIDAELAAAQAAAQDLRARHAETSRALHEVEVELAVFGTQGRRGQLDAAQIAREHAAAEHGRIGRRARAAALLRSTMTRHRDDTRRRYVEPFRAEIQRLGAHVFGADFEVDVDTDLKICARTLGGRTVPYESLSGGAKEQLGILTRLAGAALVAKEDSVPVVIDDALGFTDPDRLAKMGSVFDAVGSQGQVIVLTCDPDRYRSVIDAHRIDLTA
ncbi:AAA family ATPase [[Mycobacterium] holstebronense]|uniref:AAA family ATPase n=1 Tax=[Mycobacterium] holstebronense TaxID=3064288 RepID=A0ABM9LKJ4_9MYCO|nr:AAA family ATPase [Mycolicibacter sp. MU0102]CAJ1500648.1 AAA family ATPase [Mycolicibacter sp. MU0102]